MSINQYISAANILLAIAPTMAQSIDDKIEFPMYILFLCAVLFCVSLAGSCALSIACTKYNQAIMFEKSERTLQKVQHNLQENVTSKVLDSNALNIEDIHNDLYAHSSDMGFVGHFQESNSGASNIEAMHNDLQTHLSESGFVGRFKASSSSESIAIYPNKKQTYI